MIKNLTTDKPKKGKTPKKSVSRYINNKLGPLEENLMRGYISPYLNSQMQLAEDRNIRTGLHNGPLDAVRHAGSAAGTTSEVFPSWVPTPLKVIGSNILGAAHEFTTPGKINWKETRSDLYNNFIGSVIGALPISNYKKQQMVIDAQNNGILSNVGEEPIEEKPLKPIKAVPKNKAGGWLDRYEYGGEAGYTDVPFDYNSAWGGQFAMGGSLPGATGMMYARVGAPSNGPYAKKTKASAENGMTFYQHGLDWKPKSISKNGSGIPKNQNAKFSLPNPRDLARQNMGASESTSTGTPKKDAKVMDELAKKKQFEKYISNQPQLKQTTKSTPEQEKERLRKNKEYISQLPNAQIDQFGNVSRVNPNRSVTGEAENFMSRREDKAMEHMGKALEVASYIEGAGALAKGIGTMLKPAGTWTKELVQGSIAARKPKLPEFVTALRTEPVGFNPSAVAPHPSLNPVQQTFTGNWVQAASKQNPAAFDEVLAYVSGPERKQAGDLQLLSDVIPWSKAQKMAGQNLPYDAKIMSFGAGKYGSLENALKEGAISNREFALLKNYNTQGARITGSPNLSQLMEQTVSRLRAHPELYNPNEMLSSTLASKLRSAPIAVGSSDIIASGIQSLKNAALKNEYLLNPFKEGAKQTGKVIAKEAGIHEAKDNLKKGGVIEDDLGQWAHPGKITKINSNHITMKGVPYPVLGISDTGDRKMMYPEQEYTFDGNTVTEYPRKKKGGWLDKYN